MTEQARSGHPAAAFALGAEGESWIGTLGHPAVLIAPADGSAMLR
jgi:hypothetical protein